jgi:uncharacterized membrane protein
MLVFSLLALLAAFVLSVEKIHLLQHPDAPLSCSLNAVVNCASVMKTPQASAFGFPNSYLGLMFFPIIAAFALMALLGTSFNRRVVIILEVLSGLGLIFSYWLFSQSVYVIQILCPWCLLVTLSMTIIFATVTCYMLRHNSLNLEHSTQKKVDKFIDQHYEEFITAVVIVILAILVYLKFGDSLFLS